LPTMISFLTFSSPGIIVYPAALSSFAAWPLRNSAIPELLNPCNS
jgi:hypothetical protein